VWCGVVVFLSIPFHFQKLTWKSAIPEYPQIAEDIRQAIDEVQFGTKEPKQALDDAAAKSAKALGL
jgi:hypothetical protein